LSDTVLTFVGDVFPKDPVDVRVAFGGRVVANLEAPLTERTEGYPGKINLRADAKNLVATFEPPPVAVSLANNHVMDFKEGGYLDTTEALDALGIMHFGAGDPGNSFHNPAMVEVGGMRVALLGYAHISSTPVFHTDEHSGAARLELAEVTREIEACRSRGAHRVVVMAHWGHEQVALPPPECVVLGRAIIDAGADLVIGHHAHCIQSFERYAGKHVFYGLGNCIFPAHQLPSYFDASGTSTMRADSRPAKRNRRSLAVTWDPRTEDVVITPLLFQDGALVKGSFGVQRHRLTLDTMERYEARYARAYGWGKLQQTIHRFIARPKLPRLHHVKTISKMLRSDVRR